MYPGFFHWVKRGGFHGGCGPSEGHEGHEGHCGPHSFGGRHGHGGGPFGHGGPPFGHGGPPFGGRGGGDWDDGGGFGVRRPLRFLAWKLELEEEQVAKLAIILDELKTERAQAAVDQRRSTAAIADAIGTDTLDEAKLKEAGETRVKSAERLRDAVEKALTAMHSLMDAEQRKRLAYLLRTGALTI